MKAASFVLELDAGSAHAHTVFVADSIFKNNKSRDKKKKQGLDFFIKDVHLPYDISF